jgi:hypothetical protein
LPSNYQSFLRKYLDGGKKLSENTFLRITGYLATITSADEAKISGSSRRRWIGGAAAQMCLKWVTGLKVLKWWNRKQPLE